MRPGPPRARDGARRSALGDTHANRVQYERTGSAVQTSHFGLSRWHGQLTDSLAVAIVRLGWSTSQLREKGGSETPQDADMSRWSAHWTRVSRRASAPGRGARVSARRPGGPLDGTLANRVQFERAGSALQSPTLFPTGVSINFPTPGVAGVRILGYDGERGTRVPTRRWPVRSVADADSPDGGAPILAWTTVWVAHA
jgi:hypothetical protein